MKLIHLTEKATVDIARYYGIFRKLQFEQIFVFYGAPFQSEVEILL